MEENFTPDNASEQPTYDSPSQTLVTQDAIANPTNQNYTQANPPHTKIAKNVKIRTILDLILAGLYFISLLLYLFIPLFSINKIKFYPFKYMLKSVKNLKYFSFEKLSSFSNVINAIVLFMLLLTIVICIIRIIIKTIALFKQEKESIEIYAKLKYFSSSKKRFSPLPENKWASPRDNAIGFLTFLLFIFIYDRFIPSYGGSIFATNLIYVNGITPLFFIFAFFVLAIISLEIYKLVLEKIMHKAVIKDSYVAPTN